MSNKPISIGDYVVLKDDSPLRGYVGCVVNSYWYPRAEKTMYTIRWLNIPEELKEKYSQYLDLTDSELIKINLDTGANIYLDTRAADDSAIHDVNRFSKYIIGQKVIITSGPCRGRSGTVTHITPVINGLTDYTVNIHSTSSVENFTLSGIREEDLVPADYCRMQTPNGDVGQILTIEHMQAVAAEAYKSAINAYIKERVGNKEAKDNKRDRYFDFIMLGVLNAISAEIVTKYKDQIFDRIEESITAEQFNSLNVIFLPAMVSAMKDYIRDNPKEMKDVLVEFFRKCTEKITSRDVINAIRLNFNFENFIDDVT